MGDNTEIKKEEPIIEEPEPVTRLLDGLKIDELMTRGTTFEIHPDDLYDETLNENGFGDELLAHNHFADALDFDNDDDEDSDLSPFEKLALKMEPVDPNGYVKKRILHHGNGEQILENSLVTIHYDGFLEYGDEPFDSTMNKYARSYRLGVGTLIPGLETAILSMKNREVAQFLIEPELAYGKLGCPPRIPSDAKVMFRVEILKFVDSITADMYEKMSNEEKRKFSNVRKIAEMYQNKAKEMFKLKNYKAALKNYNTAANLLESAQLADISEQEIQQRTLLKLYTNLSICYNANNKPGKACQMCQRVYDMTASRQLTVPVKAYFQHYRALEKLGDYANAKKKLLRAKAIEPTNPEILAEATKLEEKINEYKQKEMSWAQKVMGTKEEDKIFDITDLNPEFVARSKEFIQKFTESSDEVQELPDDLSNKEIQFFKAEAESQGLHFSLNHLANGRISCIVYKKHEGA